MSNENIIIENNWVKEPSPRLNKQAKTAATKVKAIYRNAFLFYDIHVYGLPLLDETKYCVVIPIVPIVPDEETDDLLMTGDYQKNRDQINSIGKWSISASDAWESGLQIIGLKMLEKLSR